MADDGVMNEETLRALRDVAGWWPAARLPLPPGSLSLLGELDDAELEQGASCVRMARAVIAMATVERTGMPREWLAGAYAPEDLTPQK